jgi:hypothetical protein
MARRRRTLVIRSRDSGFFSNLNQVLNNLRYRLGRGGIEAASVEWHAGPEQHQFPYGNPEDGNLWIRFFEPLPFDEVPAESCETSKYASATMTGRLAYAMYKVERRWRWRYHRIFRRYIRIKPHILERAEAIHRASMAGRYCLGVHYRHPAHDFECLNPIPRPEKFISELRRKLPRARPWVVFLATDAEPAVTAFREAFGDRLVVQSGVQRSANLKEGNLHHDNPASSLVLGEQALIDCLLLTRCDLLFHVTSNLATAAGYMNPRMKMLYCETRRQAAMGYLWSVATVGRLNLIRSAARLPPRVKKALRRYIVPAAVTSWVLSVGPSADNRS